jgi:hypothetical protein
MEYKTIPVKPSTYELYAKHIAGRESWDDTLKRIIIHYEKLCARYEE